MSRRVLSIVNPPPSATSTMKGEITKIEQNFIELYGYLDGHDAVPLPGDLNITGTVTAGGLRVSDTSYDDLKFPATASKLESASTRYSFDSTDLGVAFDADARHTEEQLSYIVQMPHAWKEGTTLYPHVHWIQTTADYPNWLLSYRVYNNNESPGSWTLAPIDSHVFTWSSGSLAQISAFPSITMTGKSLSCLLDVKLWRDAANGSGEFVGAESSPVSVLMKEFDIHYEIDSLGSNEPFTKD
ncbi:hypothetical protein K0U83_09585 [bacterium]|nr:hypothetical protein [bacterium]